MASIQEGSNPISELLLLEELPRTHNSHKIALLPYYLDYTQVEIQSTGISIVDKLAKNLTDFSQQSVMRYGLKLAFSPNSNQEYFISGGNQVKKFT